MPEHKHKHSRRDRRDEIDIFRENNLRLYTEGSSTHE